ncbi:cysteine dioxygenase [Stenotrophomonas sp. JC08]|uniref:cysteine dioxygenase n=1 Tax=Stenotrophomonas sp. JC08 TaxID=3445779 RepID=UPI003FA23506
MHEDLDRYPPFPGRERLLAALDHAVQQPDITLITHTLQQVLREAIADAQIALPACVHEPVADHYARRELYHSPVHGYSVVAMTWGPGQATPLHDHSGLWCVEGVWSGTLQITQYALQAQAGERFQFRAGRGLLAGPGSAGCLIPPHEYHTICNPSPDQIAVSVHVYQRVMQRCTVFLPDPQHPHWYRREIRDLQTDDGPTPARSSTAVIGG